MFEFMDGPEALTAALCGAWALVFFSFAGLEAVKSAWHRHRKVKCPGCTSEATDRLQLCDTTIVTCRECGRRHSRHADEDGWLLHVPLTAKSSSSTMGAEDLYI